MSSTDDLTFALQTTHLGFHACSKCQWERGRNPNRGKYCTTYHCYILYYMQNSIKFQEACTKQSEWYCRPSHPCWPIPMLWYAMTIRETTSLNKEYISLQLNIYLNWLLTYWFFSLSSWPLSSIVKTIFKQGLSFTS